MCMCAWVMLHSCYSYSVSHLPLFSPWLHPHCFCTGSNWGEEELISIMAQTPEDMSHTLHYWWQNALAIHRCLMYILWQDVYRLDSDSKMFLGAHMARNKRSVCIQVCLCARVEMIHSFDNLKKQLQMHSEGRFDRCLRATVSFHALLVFSWSFFFFSKSEKQWKKKLL